MRKIRIILLLAAILSTQAAFADDQDMSSDGKACGTIAKACVDAGYTRAENADKKFWKECMKPIVMGKTVEGVTVEKSIVKNCRMHKIKEMKMELKELQKASN